MKSEFADWSKASPFFFNGSKSRIVLAANLEFQYYFVAIHIHVYRQECKIVLEVG